MSARAQNNPEAAAKSVENYVTSKESDSTGKASEALLSSANESVGRHLDQDNMPTAKFDSELQERGVLPKLALDKFSDIANADGEEGISKKDLEMITGDKSGRYDSMTKLAADHIQKNFKKIAASDDGHYLKFDNYAFWRGDPVIDQGEMKTYADAKDKQFRANDNSGKKHQGRDVENMAADIGNSLDRSGDESDAETRKIDRKLKDGGFGEPGNTEQDLKLMKAMERNGTAGKFVAKHLRPDVEDYFGENSNVTKEDLQKIATTDRSHSRRIAAKLALRNFETIDRSDDYNVVTRQFSDTESLNQSELDTWAKKNVGESGTVVRQHKPTREASEAYGDYAEKLNDRDATKEQREKAGKKADKEIGETGLLDKDLSANERSQRRALIDNLKPDEVATVASSNLERIGGKDRKITKDEAAKAADNKKLDSRVRLTARALHSNFDTVAGKDGDSSTISGSDLSHLKTAGAGRPSYAWADASGRITDSQKEAKVTKSSEQELKETALDEGANGEDRVRAIVELHDKGVKSIEMKVGDKPETAKIDYKKGRRGAPDSIYMYDGKGNVMLRGHVERGEDNEVKVTKQHARGGGEASFEGDNWTKRVKKTEDKEATLAETERKTEKVEKADKSDSSDSKNEELAKTLLDQDAKPEERLEAAQKLAEKGIKSFEMKLGNKSETVTIDYKNGKLGHLYVRDGQGNPMLRANIRNGEIEEQRTRKGPAGFEGSNWRRRVKRNGGNEAELVKIKD